MKDPYFYLYRRAACSDKTRIYLQYTVNKAITVQYILSLATNIKMGHSCKQRNILQCQTCFKALEIVYVCNKFFKNFFPLIPLIYYIFKLFFAQSHMDYCSV